MGLFFNYDKPGRGVDKDAPKKWGPFLYLELLGRKLGILIKSNLMYFIVSSPVLVLYHFFFFSMLSSKLPDYGLDAVNQIAAILSVVLVALWGSGPVSCGYTYILRNSAREEHVWLVSDFFEKSKENFKQGLVFLLIDFIALVLGVNAIGFYWGMAANNALYLYLTFVVVVGMVIYTMMHFYMYEFAVTFDNKLSAIYKNSFLMAFANMPMNLLLMVIVLVCSYFVLGMLATVGIIIVTLVIWLSMMRFPIDFYTARMIKRKIIVDESDEGSDE